MICELAALVSLASTRVSHMGPQTRFICYHCKAIFFLVHSKCHTRYRFFVIFYVLLLAASLLVCKSISVVPLSFRIVHIFYLGILNGKKFLYCSFVAVNFENFCNMLVTSCILLQLSGTEDLDNDIDELLHEFETKCQRNVLHCVQFY